VLGPILYVICHHDLPTIFQTPAINHKHKAQVLEVEDRINQDLTQLLQYSNDWHQPLNPLKTELVVYHKSVQCSKLQVKFDGIIIEQKKIFKYLGFSLDGKLSFRRLIDAQFLKLNKSFTTNTSLQSR